MEEVHDKDEQMHHQAISATVSRPGYAHSGGSGPPAGV